MQNLGPGGAKSKFSKFRGGGMWYEGVEAV